MPGVQNMVIVSLALPSLLVVHLRSDISPFPARSESESFNAVLVSRCILLSNCFVTF